MALNHNRVAKYLSLIAMTIFTVIGIVNKEITVFYILYLFWCDEFLRTFFDRWRWIRKPQEFQYRIAFLSNNKQRFFMLWVYFVFIVIIFGLVMDWKESELVLRNFEVLFFRNGLFNYTLGTFLLREVYLLTNDIQDVEAQFLMSNGVIILHLSIILGIFSWFLSKEKFPLFEDYATVFSIIPFLILKLIFEIKLDSDSVNC